MKILKHRMVRILVLGIVSVYGVACSGEITISNSTGPITGNAYVGVGPSGPYAGGTVSVHAGGTSITATGQIGTTTTTSPTAPKAKDVEKTTATSTIDGTNFTGDIPNSQVPETSGAVAYTASNVRLGSY